MEVRSVNRVRAALAVAVVSASFAVPMNTAVARASTFRPCYDDTTMPGHHWTHGNPNKGLTGSANGDNGYYYLAIQAGCGPASKGSQATIAGQVHLASVVKGKIDADGMCWRLDISPEYTHHKLVMAVVMGPLVTLSYAHAVVGEEYRLRIANLEDGVTVTDHAFFSG
jgi:hypothetical protein